MQNLYSLSPSGERARVRGKQARYTIRDTQYDRNREEKKMQVSYNLLKDYVDIDLSAEELAQRLTINGIICSKIDYKWHNFREDGKDIY
jgi:hypothetical protein